MNQENIPIERAASDLRAAVSRMPALTPRIAARWNPAVSFIGAAIAVLLVVGIPVLLRQTGPAGGEPLVPATSTMSTSTTVEPATTTSVETTTSTLAVAAACGTELPFDTIVPDDFDGPFSGPSPLSTSPVEDGQVLLHWTGRGGSVELRWPANAEYTESADWGVAAAAQDTDPTTFVTVEDMNLDGVVYEDVTQAYATLPTEAMEGPCDAVQLRVLGPNRDGNGISHFGALTGLEHLDRPRTLVIYPELPRPRDLVLIVESLDVASVPEVLECSGGSDALEVPPIKNETISDRTPFPTPVEALEAFLATDDAESWPRTGYFELQEPDGSITYGNPLDDLSPDPRPENGLVISISVIQVEGGWAVDSWSTSGC